MMDAKDETALPATALGVARGQRIAAAGVAALIVAAGVALASSPDTQALTLSLAFGALFGFVLQRARFCFYCIWRDYIVARDPRGMLGILTALAVGLAGYTLVFGAWLPDPSTHTSARSALPSRWRGSCSGSAWRCPARACRRISIDLAKARRWRRSH